MLQSIMQKITESSDGRVRLAAGTMYGAIKNLLRKKSGVRRVFGAFPSNVKLIIEDDVSEISYLSGSNFPDFPCLPVQQIPERHMVHHAPDCLVHLFPQENRLAPMLRRAQIFFCA